MYTVGQQLLLLSSMCLFLALLCAFCPSDFIFTCYQWFNLQFLASEITCIQCVGVWGGEVKVLNKDFQTTFHLPSPPTPSTHFFFSSIIFHRPLSNPSKSCALLGYWNDWWWRPARFLLTSPSAWQEPVILTTNVILLLYLLNFSEISCFLILELINMCSIWYSQLEAVLCKLNCIYMDIIYWVLR